ncbi:hypothetical protein ASG91_05155 [Phycicoccus sp. Soil802]|nr:hypothetical protein ASG91_05155 [Phycicoccus sp. Soil802]
MRRALVVAAAVTTGFVVVFGAVGVAVSALSLTLGPWLSVVTLLAGLVLLVVGAVQLSGRDIPFRVPRARLLVDGSASGMVAYGVIYASVSLSCTLPVFLAAVVSAFSAPGATPTAGVLAALAYAGGMGLVMATLAVVVGLLGRRALARTRAWTRHVGRVSGLVVLAAALYVLWYSWVELASYRGTRVAAGPVAWVRDLSASISQGVVNAGTWPTMLTLGAVLAAVATATFITRRWR